MEASITEMKSKAVDVLEKLSVNKPFCNSFERSDTVYLFEAIDGIRIMRSVDKDSEIYRMVLDVESKTKCKVYAVLHSHLYFGEVYDFLIVSNYIEDFDYLHTVLSKGQHLVYVYCMNITYPSLSESGSIVVNAHNGFIERIG